MSRATEEVLEGIRTILRTFTIDETRFPPAEGRMKYNGIDFQAIHFISRSPGCKGAELAAFLGVAPTTAQSVCDRLIERGLVQREAHRTSRRAVAYHLTPEGVEVCAAIRRQDLSNCETMLRALPAAERRSFAAQISRIAEVLDAKVDT